MDSIPATATVRIARPTSDLAALERFWVDGVGLEVLWRTDGVPDHGHELLMVGPAGAGWHLELVADAQAAQESHPGPEDLLVLYLGEPAGQEWVARIRAHGGTVVPAHNPYWDTWGVTIQDPDGYLLVLSHRTWG
ncbi:VOC family protein [Ornithinimicrobium faecis]|uniref:VOC family protein n=1 Tax=Ornithinimicrobium faecis TaxID=2934158 RepID=UPI0021185206|nr:VOC family protein [Ornithinimicrobium sp. HY1745]